MFGKEADGPDGPRLVHGILTRDDAGVTTLDDWDTLGMRATQSRTTKLDHVVIPDARIVRFLPVGPNADPFIFALFANFLTLIASVYAGIADRALELAVEAAQKRTSLKNGERPTRPTPTSAGVSRMRPSPWMRWPRNSRRSLVTSTRAPTAERAGSAT
ncbi:hypothetical protein GCM10025869_11060 [Homoserinibacter gongjuensis]|uniref:Uncharacterized protein n=1 Tax=Homoserinibacter gongjuensis TaxID=1162968 RepID=A0ABQ6JS67_9MICO|nr:hypothetical protein GCM10025869_11060 [Homoserinibacter gongjuensis]